jgi:hypothetical protein
VRRAAAPVTRPKRRRAHTGERSPARTARAATSPLPRRPSWGCAEGGCRGTAECALRTGVVTTAAGGAGIEPPRPKCCGAPPHKEKLRGAARAALGSTTGLSQQPRLHVLQRVDHLEEVGPAARVGVPAPPHERREVCRRPRRHGRPRARAARWERGGDEGMNSVNIPVKQTCVITETPHMLPAARARLQVKPQPQAALALTSAPPPPSARVTVRQRGTAG